MMKYSWCLSLLLVFSTFSYGQDAIKILPLGNSITQGEGSSIANDGTTHNTWRLKLWQRLKDTMGYNIDFIGTLNQAYPCEDFTDMKFDWDHEGHWAWTIDEILYGRSGTCNGTGRLGIWLDSTGAPDYVLIHLGTNDCWDGQSVSSSVLELEALIDTLQAYNNSMTIILAQIIGHESISVDACVQQFNDSIPALATRKTTSESEIVVVDQYTDFDPALDLYDAAHPNDAGEEKIFEKWFAALDPLLSGTTLPVELSRFAVKKIEKGIDISWSTASEIDVDFFKLERKIEGQEFVEIYRKSANGDATTPADYAYFDQLPPKTSGHVHYRLEMVDLDGTTDWSPSKSVQVAANKQIRLYPTVLSNGNRTLQILVEKDSQLQIIDSDGRLHFETYLPAHINRIHLPQLSLGIYFAQILNNQGDKTIPILIME
ncbi:MAG: T9SS type A sorting domain-containing protein [Saprospiraceae bacterium]|nr:T9SS type A sorting domain-containing protein [Saprospiraceae bacterium]